MSSQRPESPAAQENTPLLDPARDNESRPADEEAPDPQDAPERRGRTVPRLYRSFYLLLVSSTVLTVVDFFLDGVTWWMLTTGGSFFSYYDWTTESCLAMLFWTCILAIVFSIANVLRIRHSGQAIQAGINIIIFGGMTVATIASAGQLFLDRVAWSEDYCRNNYHEGRQHECEDWAAKYVVISWIWLVLSLVLGICYAALTVMSLVVVYRERPTRQAGGSGSSWNLPVGQVSVQVTLRWGPQASQEDVEPRSTEQPASNREAVVEEQA